MRMILMLFLLGGAALAEEAKVVKDRELDLEMQLLSAKIDTMKAHIAPLEAEISRLNAQLQKLLKSACAAQKLEVNTCEAKIEEGHVVISPKAATKK